MTPRQYQRVKELFRAALDLPPSERARWVGEHAGDEEVVRGEVLDMLAEDEHSDAAGEQLESGAAGMFAASLADESIPQQIGRYRVLRRVGEGGMGTVYEAQQQNPRRRVALKVIRAGLRREEAFKRFQREANVLGLLLHPGIAQVYEAGVAEAGAGGQPFIAMEFVEGVPLDRHVRDTATDARWILEAAARICEALHYAHEKGVVHRDLKPENILVVGGSSPVQLKIVDFGVARITSAEEQAVTLATAAGQLVGTLAYMSPEQVSGDSRRVDRRSDVYAVGVMLYELLSGVRPYDLNGVSIAEAARKICEEEPMALGAINSKFRGDVETIVAKAMEKDPQRRYPSAAALAADLRRYLANEPILARPPSTIYQIRKFAARNKAFVGSVVATFLALGVGLGLATYGFLSASRERNVAQAERQEKEHALQNEQAAREASDAVTEFLTETLAAADPASAGRNVTVREALDNAAGAVGTKFADKPLIDARIRYALAQTYVGLGEYAKALEQAEPAVEIFERLTGRFSRQSLDSRTILGEVYYFLGRATQALGEFETVLANRRAAPAPDDFGLATAASNVAFILTAQQKYAEAEPLFREALALQERAAGPDDATSIDLKGNLARLFLITGRLEDAQTLYEDVLARSRRVRGAEHPQTVLTMSNLAVVYSRSGQPDAARALLEEALEIQRRVLGESHSQTLITLNNLATELNGLGEGQRAIELLRDGLARAREAYGDTHPRTRMLVEQLGRIATDMGDSDAAEAYLEEHARLTKEAEGPGSRAYFVSHLSLARHYLARAAYGRAEPLIAEMLDELGEPAEDTATCWWDFRRLAALCALRQQRYAEAEAILRDLERLSSPAVATAAEQIPSPSADTVPERAAFAWGAERRAQLLDDLVALYESWNRPADAAYWKKQRPEVASDAASSAR